MGTFLERCSVYNVALHRIKQVWLRSCCIRYFAGSWAEEGIHVKARQKNSSCFIRIVTLPCATSVVCLVVEACKLDGARQSQHGSSHCLSWICKGSFDKRHKCIEEVLTSAEAELVRVQLVKRLKQLLNKGCLNVCLHVVLRVVISKPSPSSVARYLCFVTCLYKSVRAVAYCYIAVVFQCLSVQNVAVKLRLALCFMRRSFVFG